MKKIITLLLLIYASFSYSQTQLALPLLKENSEIDSLMNIVIKNSNTHEICFSFTTINSPYGYLFSVLRLGEKQRGVYYHALQPSDINDIGYFTIKGYTVFVSGDDNPSDYFKKTSVTKIFDFIGLKGTIYWFTPDSLFKDDPEHHKGKFDFVSRNYRDKPELIKHNK